MKKVFTVLLILLSLVPGVLKSQDKVIDQIVAIVGSNVILKSEVEMMNLENQAQGVTSTGDMKCEILESFLVDKLLIAEAQLDTDIVITDSQINQQMDNRMQQYINYIGSEKEVEAYFKKPITTIKSEMKEGIRNQLYSSQMQNKIIDKVTATPSEVRFNYRTLPPDQVPLIPTQFEYAQITLKPVVDLEEENRVKAQLRELKARIEGGTSFATMAVLYSEDGSAKDGGELGYRGRNELDPEYAAVAFNLKEGKVSNVVQSEFGYHIIQLIDKKGEKINTRHIILRPKISPVAKLQARNRLDSLANLIRKNTLTFEQAAAMFSADKTTRNNGGIAINQDNLSSKFTVEQLNPEVSKVITSMNLNEISKPFETMDDETKQPVLKIVKLLNKIEGHKANLQNDYQQLSEMFLQKKKEKVLEDWVSERQKKTYIRIDDTYANCNFKYKNWIK